MSRCAGGTVYNMVFCVFFLVAPNGCANLSQRGNRSGTLGTRYTRQARRVRPGAGAAAAEGQLVPTPLPPTMTLAATMIYYRLAAAELRCWKSR